AEGATLPPPLAHAPFHRALSGGTSPKAVHRLGLALWNGAIQMVTAAPDAATGAVEEHPLVGTRQPEDLAGLRGGEALEVAERDRRPVSRRQRLHRAANGVHHLALEQHALRSLVTPRGWRVAPATGVIELVGVCQRRVQQRRTEVHAGAGQRDVHAYPVDPGPQRRAATEAVQ